MNEIRRPARLVVAATLVAATTGVLGAAAPASAASVLVGLRGERGRRPRRPRRQHRHGVRPRFGRGRVHPFRAERVRAHLCAAPAGVRVQGQRCPGQRPVRQHVAGGRLLGPVLDRRRSGTWTYATLGATSLDVPDGGAVALAWQQGAVVGRREWRRPFRRRRRRPTKPHPKPIPKPPPSQPHAHAVAPRRPRPRTPTRPTPTPTTHPLADPCALDLGPSSARRPRRGRPRPDRAPPGAPADRRPPTTARPPTRPPGGAARHRRPPAKLLPPR